METNHTEFPQNAWRNRPGRDLVVALAIAYVALAGLSLTVAPSLSGLASSAMILALTPVGLILAIMKADLNAALGLGLLLALAVVFVVRLPGIVRIPLLVLIFAGCYYCTLQAGTVIS